MSTRQNAIVPCCWHEELQRYEPTQSEQNDRLRWRTEKATLMYDFVEERLSLPDLSLLREWIGGYKLNTQLNSFEQGWNAGVAHILDHIDNAIAFRREEQSAE